MTVNSLGFLSASYNYDWVVEKQSRNANAHRQNEVPRKACSLSLFQGQGKSQFSKTENFWTTADLL